VNAAQLPQQDFFVLEHEPKSQAELRANVAWLAEHA